MINMNRRQLLKTSVLGGAGTLSAAALGFAQPFQPTQGQGEPGGLSPNFAHGLVQAVEKGIIIAVDEDRAPLRVAVNDGSRVWKGVDTTFDDVQPGDFFYVRGTRADDGTLVAETIWLNIVNLTIEIQNVSDDRMDFVDHNGTGVGRLMPYTVAVHDLAPPSRDLSTLAVAGRYVQIVGTVQPDTGEIHISRIIA